MRRGFLLFGIVIFIVSGMSCSHLDSTDSITLVYSNKVNYEPFIIANALGYFADEGLSVDVKLVNGGIHAAEALMTGSADAGAMGDGPAVVLISRNAPVKIVTRYGKGEHIHRLLATQTIRGPEDLKGKRVGIQAGSSTHGGFLLWAESRGLDIHAMRIVPLNPLDMPQAMQTGQIDAIAGSEPWPTNVENLCGATVHELDDFSGLGNDFPHVLVVTKRLLDDRPETVRKLIRVISRAVDHLKAHPDDAAVITSRQIGLSLEDQKRCTSRLIWDVGWDNSDLKSMNMTAQYMKRFGKIEKIPDLQTALDIQLPSIED